MSQDSKDGAPAPVDDSKKSITLYVSNLPRESSKTELEDFFRAKADSFDNVCMKLDKFSRQFSGTCFVTYTVSEDGMKLIDELNGSDYKGQALKVEKAHRDYIHDYNSEARRARPPERDPRYGERYRRPQYDGYGYDRMYRDRGYPPDYYDRAPYDRAPYDRPPYDRAPYDRGYPHDRSRYSDSRYEDPDRRRYPRRRSENDEH